MTTTSDTVRHCVGCGGALPPARSGRVCPRCLAPLRRLRGTLHVSTNGSRALCRSDAGLEVVDLQSGATVPIPETAGAGAAGMADDAAFFLTKQPQDSHLILHEWSRGKSVVRCSIPIPGARGFTPDWDVRVQPGRWLRLRPDKKTIRIHDINGGALTWSESVEWNALHAALSPDGRTLAVTSEDSSLRLFD